ncbi:MAG: hypothetical protein HZB55_14845 [Deltaproteobacteria bacterium]|nr:hypothetical protein [Deltaproteobacteria bacterium]
MTTVSMAAISLLFIVGAAVSPCPGAQQEVHPARYLVDGRVHVAVTAGPEPLAGELWWVDTVSGRAGEARVRLHGSRFVVEWGAGQVGEALVVPDVAIVFAHTPWGGQGPGTSLGVSLD